MTDGSGSPDRRTALLLGGAALLAIGGLTLSFPPDPVVAADEPLPDLPAVTLTGDRLDARFFGDRPWIILVWLPG